MPGGGFEREIIEPQYGKALVLRGKDAFEDFFFLARHGVDHSVPPHMINYRANIKALKQLGVERVLATFAVGSINHEMPPMSLVAIDQFIDFTSGRKFTFYEGGESGLAHTEMTEPYCGGLRKRLLEVAQEKSIHVHPKGTYVCTNGPRLETAAEISMFEKLGGDVVGMTCVPEAPLAREAGLHYAALAFSINWGAGLHTEKIEFHEEGIIELKQKILGLFIETLRTSELAACHCEG